MTVQDQVNLENEILEKSVELYRQRVVLNQQRGSESLNNYGQTSVSLAVSAVAEAIDKWKVKTDTEGRGRRAGVITYLNRLPSPVQAVYALKTIIDSASRTQTLQHVAYTIGTWFQNEVNLRKIDKQNPWLFKGVTKNLATNPKGHQPTVRRQQYFRAAKKYGDVEIEEWPHTEKVRIGAVMIDLVIESTGWFVLERMPGKRRGEIVVLHSTPAYQKMIADFVTRDELLHPLFIPTIIPPQPYTGLYGGGYYTPRFQRPLVKLRGPEHRAVLEKADLRRPVAAVNAMQETAWRVNHRVLEVARKAWESGMEIGDMPPRYDRQRPPEPDYKQFPEEWKRWKKVAAEVFRRNRSDDSVRSQIDRTLSLATRFGEYPAIWFPYQLDFRGRMYAVPQLLNPQGSDLAKGLLEFADGKELGEEGVKWLEVHLANTFGIDKVSFSERRKWVSDNRDKILAVAMSPLDNLWWATADKPWQFLAAAFAFADYDTAGISAVAHVPVHLDGTCNGMQHLAAMLRDPVCGVAVNLTPSPKPADLYSEVASQVVADLQAKGDAWGWSRFGVDRNAVKRPVMVLPYGGTKDAVFKYLLLWYQEQVDKGLSVAMERPRKAIRDLADVVWDAMLVKTERPRAAMDWLQAAAKKLGKAAMKWTAPSGFVVYQAYRNMRKIRITTKLGGKVYQFMTKQERQNEVFDARKQAQAVAPNFVHSYDAAMLVATIERAKREGINSFAAVHDSFGTLPSDTGRLVKILREEFHRLYDGRDPLGDFGKEVGFDGPRPEPGDLNLDEVLESPYIFA